MTEWRADMVRVTALMDDHASEHKALTAEHGLSYLVEMPELRLLFDCGASSVPMANAHRLGLSLKELDAVVLSHSHYDHAAGYRDLIEAGLGSRHLYIGPGFSGRSSPSTACATRISPPGSARTFCKITGSPPM